MDHSKVFIVASTVLHNIVTDIHEETYGASCSLVTDSGQNTVRNDNLSSLIHKLVIVYIYI